jgi:pyruvate/2-oxoacid:ferredoxin oxidoreductase beta subunit
VFFRDFEEETCFEVNSSEFTYIMAAASVLEKDMWKAEIVKQKLKRREQRVLTVTNKAIDVEEYKRKQREKYEEEQRIINEIKREKLEQRENIEGKIKVSV